VIAHDSAKLTEISYLSSKNKMLYGILKYIITIGIRLYYKEVKINNLEYLPSSGPLIIVANHPNTLMDAWVIGMLSKRPIYYIAKGTLFNSSWKLKILRGLKMIPINRSGEQKSVGVDNTETFRECYELLERGEIIVIFPEGTSYRERVLRELKSGAARIALETENRNNGKLGLKIVAVGLNYSQPEKFRSNIYIDIDRPESLDDYYEAYKENPREASKKLTTHIRRRLEKVLLTTESREEEQIVEQLYQLLSSKYIQEKDKGVKKDVDKMKAIKDRIDELKLLEPWTLNSIILKMRAIQWKLDKMHIRADFLDRKFRSVLFYRQLFLSICFIALALPLLVIGFMHNAFQYYFADKLILRLTKDIEYYAPLAVLIGLFLYPIVYGSFLYAANYFLGWNGWQLIVYFSIMPLSGLFAFWLARYIRHINFKVNFIFLMYRRANAIEQLKSDKSELKKMVFNI
jgi:1-acyl-sn-glycerol-3-phosphate acyltransferase